MVESTWKRMGLAHPPEDHAGQGVGIIVLDEMIPHISYDHMKNRVKQVKVHKDLSVTCTDMMHVPQMQEADEYSEHGLMVLSLLAHEQKKYRDNLYKGLAPSSHFIFLPTSKPNRIKVGLEWIIKQNWNAKILLNLFVPQERGWMSPTNPDPYVQAMQPAIDAGLLVIAAGGNSRAHNNQHPKQFLVVGGYNDKGSSNPNGYESHPFASFGVNGDGDWRPDVLAPYTYLPLPSLSRQGFDYFGGTCGGATLIAGLSANLWSIKPDLTANDIRNVLIEKADRLEGFPAPIINGEKAMTAIKQGYRNHQPPLHDPLMEMTTPNPSIASSDPLKRALALTTLIKNDHLTRAEIWRYTKDESPMVKKVAIQGLHGPLDTTEREKYWKQLHKESSEWGVKECWAYTLLNTSTKEELHQWMTLANCHSIDILICIHLFLRKYYPEAPEVEHLHNYDPDVIDSLITPVVEWYQMY